MRKKNIINDIIQNTSQKTDQILSFYKYPTLIEPIYEIGSNVAKYYRVVGQDSSFSNTLFHGEYEECIKWQKENCI